MHVNSLSWADDLILLSDSQTGLQNCLNKLSDFCKKWHLSVNTLKTKCMVFRKRKQNNLCTFHFNNSYIEMVEEYVYLGITFTSNGKFTKAIVDRVNKASRAIFIVRKAITTAGNVNVNLGCNTCIFDKQIQAITRHSHRHSPRGAQGLSHMTIKAKVILALFYQKSYALSSGQNALDNSKKWTELWPVYIFHVL